MNSSNYNCLVKLASQTPRLDNTASLPHIPTPEEMRRMRASYVPLKLDPPATLIDYRLPRTSAPLLQPRTSFGDKLRNTWSIWRPDNPPPIPTPEETERMLASLKYVPIRPIDPRLPKTSVPLPQSRNTTSAAGAMMQAPLASQASPKDNTTSLSRLTPELMLAMLRAPYEQWELEEPILALDPILPKTAVPLPQPSNSFGDKLRNTWSIWTQPSRPPLPTPEETERMLASLRYIPTSEYRLPRTVGPYPQLREQEGKLGLTTPKTMGYVHPGSIVDWKSIPDRLRNLRQYISGFPGSMYR